MSVSTKPPSGMRDFLAPEIALRRYAISTIQDVYESAGFVALETPTLERLSTLTGKYGEEGDQLLYRVQRRRDAFARAADQAAQEGRPVRPEELSDLGLRYDLTVPFARVVAQYRTLPRFYRRYQIQPVWRADRPGRGRFREFYQCDLDAVGSTGRLVEGEVLLAATRALLALGFKEIELRYNHRALLRAMIEAAGVDLESSPELEASALVAIDKLDKIGADGVRKELDQRGLSPQSAERLLELVQGESGFDALRAAVGEGGQQALRELDELREVLAEGPVAPLMKPDPTLARGLGYYTGLIFEFRIPGLPSSVAGGGRYDGLIGMFGKEAIPAVGCSLGLERLLVLMQEQGLGPRTRPGAELLLCWLDVEPAVVLACADALRSQGLRVGIYPDRAKLKKQLQYAASDPVQVPFVGVLGAKEASAKALTLKDLASGEQRTLAWSEVAQALRRAGGSDPEA